MSISRIFYVPYFCPWFLWIFAPSPPYLGSLNFPMISRSRRPRPPLSLGLQTRSQLTNTNLALASLPSHKKFLWMLRIFRRIDLGAERIEKRFTSMAWRTDLTRTNLLGKFRGLRVQLASLALILSRRYFQDTFRMAPFPSRTPSIWKAWFPWGNPESYQYFSEWLREC